MDEQQESVSGDRDQDEAGVAGEEADDALEDFITGRLIKGSPKEEVRQRIAQALEHEYGLSRADMAPDFPVPVETDGRRRSRRVEIAIFARGRPHELENLRRVVMCRPEPKNGAKSVTKIRDHEQARDELDQLWRLMQAVPGCEYGLWTNGLDFFFLHKERTRFEDRAEPRVDWPPADDYVPEVDVDSRVRLRRADPDMLRVAFRRCHNFIHGNEGMSKDAAFWQFLYLIFAKMLDERRNPGRPSFFVRPTEPFSPDGRRAIQTRVEPLFQAVMQEYGPKSPNPIFRGSEEIRLTPRALAFLVSELARYDFTRTPIDAKGIAYQELVGTNLRGDRGQYFTPRRAINLVVEILDPKEDETVLDPACGTGGFLRAALDHQLNRWREADRAEGRRQIAEDLANYEDRLRAYADQRLFGADFDESLVRAASMNLMLMAKTAGNVYHLDSLLFPDGDLPGVKAAKAKLPDRVRVLMTNPPFGADIPYDPAALAKFRSGVARTWRRQNGKVVPTGEAGSVAPEVLFVQRCVEWLEPGGRLGIVLPNGLLSNPGPNDQGVREWIMQECWVLASVELPVETFIVEANVNILTTLLFLKRKTDDERIADTLRGEVDYPVFMAVAERVGVDRRGNPLYRRRPDGEEIWERPPDEEFIRNGRLERRRRPRRRVLDDDLPTIAAAYHEFRRKHPEPGGRPMPAGRA